MTPFHVHDQVTLITRVVRAARATNLSVDRCFSVDLESKNDYKKEPLTKFSLGEE